jgi:hypothetical protein
VNTGATVTVTNTDFQDISMSPSVDLSGITGNSGNCGGNSGITFTTPATQTHTTSSGGNMSDSSKWTSRVPLPQDNIVVDSNTTGTVTLNMPRMGTNITLTGFVGTWSASTAAIAMYGSLTLPSGMTYTGGNNLSFMGRGTHTVTTGGNSITTPLFFGGSGGTYTLQDNLTTATGIKITLGSSSVGSCTFVDNGVTVGVDVATTSHASQVLTLTGTWNLSNASATTVWNVTSSSTITASTATIAITTAGTNTRTFAGNGNTYGTLTYTVAGSTGKLFITGSNTFDTINFSDASNARTLSLTAATTTTIVTALNIKGTSANKMTLNSVTAATHTLSKSSGFISCDNASITNSIATGGATWVATRSTNVSGNTGWNFSPIAQPQELAKSAMYVPVTMYAAL